jgi:hypothetical protein
MVEDFEDGASHYVHHLFTSNGEITQLRHLREITAQGSDHTVVDLAVFEFQVS